MNEWLRQALPLGGEGPLYRRLTDIFLAAIENGELPPGSRLPTVRELAKTTGLSHGTIKRAYDDMERLGAIIKIQGRGTFVHSRDSDEARGKKESAMLVIENLFDEMLALGFSLRETEIFFNLKLRERDDGPRSARVAVVDCNPEALHIISGQIAQIHGCEVARFLLDDVLRSPSLMKKEYDLIVTTANHYEQLAQATGQEEKISRVMLNPSRGTIAQLAKIESGAKVGAVVASDRFAGIIRKVCADLIPSGGKTQPEMPHTLFGGEGGIAAFVKKLDVAILPGRYATFCSAQELDAIRGFGKKGEVIEFTYQIDAGSLMYLEQRIAGILEE